MRNETSFELITTLNEFEFCHLQTSCKKTICWGVLD